LKDDLTAVNVAGATLVNILPEDDFYGGTCLFCGLKQAARVSAYLDFNFPVHGFILDNLTTRQENN
jgi:hypothetical protein